MHLGINALNIRAGGGKTHLVEILRAAAPSKSGFAHVTLWSGESTLDSVEDRPWLSKVHCSATRKSLAQRHLWEKYRLHENVVSTDTDLLFVPGGVYSGKFRPFVSMSRNMLPFETRELKRFGLSKTTLRYLFLRRAQTSTFRKASGLIFISDYARSTINNRLNLDKTATTTIPHGVDFAFRQKPRQQREIKEFSELNPFRFLYVSIINFYKHQWHTAKAIAMLRKQGFPVSIEFVGPAYPPALKRLSMVQNELDPSGQFLKYSGPVPHVDLPAHYLSANGFVFASSCENMPNILVEAMAAGLPIVCSNRGPMPEVLGDAGLYFDPEKPEEILDAIRTIILNPELRHEIASKAYLKANDYSWEKCADQTFSFLARVAHKWKRNN